MAPATIVRAFDVVTEPRQPRLFDNGSNDDAIVVAARIVQ
jgi:hypothetical protein